MANKKQEKPSAATETSADPGSGNVDTGGGAYVNGDINTHGGDVALRDINVYHNTHLPSPDPVQKLDLQRRKTLIKRVQSAWTNGFLKAEVQAESAIPAPLQNQSYRPIYFDGTGDIGEMLKVSESETEVLAAQTSLYDFFQENNEHPLLILGEAGSGKTILLLRLAQRLLEDAAQEVEQPVPVVLNLKSWGKERLPFEEWVLQELKSPQYSIPVDSTRKWLQHDQLILLLDGLDEVEREHRRACAEAINQFRERYLCCQMVVCSRTQVFQDLQPWHAMRWIVLLQPLSPAQIEQYLQQAGPQFAAVLQAIRQNESLRELARIPLILSLLPVVYASVVDGAQSVAEAEIRIPVLIARYVDKVLTGSKQYAQEKTAKAQAWLSWLAGQMTLHQQGQIVLESIQPGWLPSRLWQAGFWVAMFLLVTAPLFFLGWLATQLAVPIFYDQSALAHPVGDLHLTRGEYYAWIAGVASGLSGAWIGWLTINRKFDMHALWAIGLWVALTFSIGALPAIVHLSYALPVTLLVGGSAGLLFILIYRQFGKLQNKNQIGIRAAIEPIAYKDFDKRSFSLGMFLGAFFGLCSSLLLYFVAMLNWENVPGDFPKMIAKDYDWWFARSGYAFTIFFAIIFGVLMGLLNGKVKLEGQSRPNRAIWLSGQGGLIFGAVIFVGAALPSYLVSDPKTLFWPVLALFGGLVGGLYMGGYAFLQHFVLRFMLWRAGCIPRNYVAFLDDMADLDILRPLGYGYDFRHGLLKEHFAGLYPTDKAA